MNRKAREERRGSSYELAAELALGGMAQGVLEAEETEGRREGDLKRYRVPPSARFQSRKGEERAIYHSHAAGSLSAKKRQITTTK